MQAEFRRRVYAMVASIPRGCVVSYGQLAAWAGYPQRSRQVGQALAQAPVELPWHRVVNARGCIRTHPPERQISVLQAEGVVVVGQRVDLKVFGWQVSPLHFADL